MADSDSRRYSNNAGNDTSSDIEKAAPNNSNRTLNFPETDLDRGIVGWDKQDDPANPQNFAPPKKWGLLALISSITLISPLASSMFSPAVGYMASDLKVTNQTLLSFSVSIFLLGYTVCLLRPKYSVILLTNVMIYSSVHC